MAAPSAVGTAPGPKTAFVAQEAVAIRDMIQRPATVVETDWLHFLEARRTCYRQLYRNLRERRRPYGVGDDPIFELQQIMKAAARPNVTRSAGNG